VTPFRVSEADLRRAMLPPAGAPVGDALEEGAPPRVRPAAVLCAVACRPEGLAVILTRRPTTMRVHAGQIAFPGGKCDPSDRSPLAAALREAREEIGLPAEQIEVLGPFERYVTRTGFAVTPFVGLVDPGFRPLPQPGEVEDVFEAPLDFLMDPANHQRLSREVAGRLRPYWAMPWRDRFIWGVTAGILRRLSERVAEARRAAAA
jgi:8-oxo-dGTP pyrophosphatase MutT (NUDIX family)